MPSVVGPIVTLCTSVGLAANPSRNSGLQVAGDCPSKPASVALSVPWPLPVWLKLPNKCTCNFVARSS
jgi:hypothetical protein